MTRIAKKPYIFLIFRGGGVRSPCLLSGSAHAYKGIQKQVLIVVALVYHQYLDSLYAVNLS